MDPAHARWSQAVFYFSSGTGNACRAAGWAAARVAAAGVAARVVPLPDADPAHELVPGARTLLGVLGPTHGFTAPWSVIRFALGLPAGRGTEALVSFTRAGTRFGKLFLPGLDGTACYLIALILAVKGYHVRGCIPLDMPSNWMSLHPGYGPASARAMAARQRTRLDRFMDALLAGRRSFGGLVSLLCGLALLPVSLGYLLMGRFLLAKLFFASRRCNGCGLCARSCAHGGVRMRGTPPRPYWTFDCESCMRCMGYCPRQAVEAGHSLAVLLIWLLTLPAVPAAMGLAARHVPAVARALALRPVAWAVGWAWSMLVLWAVYGLVWRLARWPAFNALLTWTTFTHLYRRYHEPDTRLRQVVGQAFQPDKDNAE